MVEYTQIVASTKGSFKSLTAGAPAAETWEGRKDVKVATLRQEGPSSADRWHQVAEDLLLGFDQNCTFFPLTSYMEELAIRVSQSNWNQISRGKNASQQFCSVKGLCTPWRKEMLPSR